VQLAKASRSRGNCSVYVKGWEKGRKAKQGNLHSYSSPSSSRSVNQFRPATMKPQPGRDQEDVEVLVERPYSHDRSSPPSSPGPRPATTARPRPTPPLRARPYYRRWSPWIVSATTIACVVVFVVTMYVNDCPRRRSATGGCAAGFLGRFAFQPLKENPLLGPSSATYARIVSHHPLVPFLLHCIAFSSYEPPTIRNRLLTP
jgi:hypothetical protein